MDVILHAKFKTISHLTLRLKQRATECKPVTERSNDSIRYKNRTKSLVKKIPSNDV